MKLPTLCDRPDFTSLVAVLELPQNNNENNDDLLVTDSTKHSGGLKFPMDIIKSDLQWLSTDQRDAIYDLASKRIAENCGRTAMPEMKRKWVIPADELYQEFELILREPPLTGDNLGLKTWATSYAISKQIGQIGRDHFSHLICSKNCTKSTDSGVFQASTQVLELGSGTGLVGLAAAGAWGVPVLSTDLEPILENLRYNIQANQSTISKLSGGSIQCRALDWRKPEQFFSEATCFELILAADPLYDDYHPHVLAHTIDIFLKKDINARALVAIPLRDKYTIELSKELKKHLLLKKFQIVGVDSKQFRDEDWAGPVTAPENSQIESTIWQRSGLRL